MILVELTAGALFGVLGLILLALLSPAILLFIMGIITRKRKPKLAKVFFILCGLYFVIGGGVCGVMLAS